MRKLRTGDLFSFARVIKASGIREDLIEYLQKITKDADQERVGINTIFLLFEALADKKAESAVYECLAPVFEMEAKEVEDMPPAELISMLKQLAEENDLPSFFASVFGTLGKS